MTPNGYECFECGKVEETGGEDWLGDGVCARCKQGTIGPVYIEPCPDETDCASENHDFNRGDHVTTVPR